MAPGIPPRSVSHAADASERWRSVAMLRRMRPSDAADSGPSPTPGVQSLLFYHRTSGWFVLHGVECSVVKGKIKGGKSTVSPSILALLGVYLITTIRFFFLICISFVGKCRVKGHFSPAFLASGILYTDSKVTDFCKVANL